MTDFTTKGVTTATLSAVIVRACDNCGEKREMNSPCAGCGNPEPAREHDLGVVSAYYKNPLKRLAWNLFGQHMAAARAQEANGEANS